MVLRRLWASKNKRQYVYVYLKCNAINYFARVMRMQIQPLIFLPFLFISCSDLYSNATLGGGAPLNMSARKLGNLLSKGTTSITG